MMPSIMLLRTVQLGSGPKATPRPGAMIMKRRPMRRMISRTFLRTRLAQPSSKQWIKMDLTSFSPAGAIAFWGERLLRALTASTNRSSRRFRRGIMLTIFSLLSPEPRPMRSVRVGNLAGTSRRYPFRHHPKRLGVVHLQVVQETAR